MKKIVYLFLLVIILFSANAFSQINGCNTVPKLRGPLLIDCQSSSTTTSHYYIQDANGISSLYWDLGPSNLVGNIISFPSATEVEVKWSPNAVALNGYLVVSNIGGQGGTDTLWPQSKCCNPPANLTGKISDLDDNFLTGQQVAAAFLGNSSFSSGTNTVTVIGGTYFIEGQMNLANISLKFIGSTLIMGSGTVIYLGEGFLPPAKFSIDDVHINGTSCGMWRGIKAPGDGRISLKNSYISDAEIAVEATNCKFSIECSNTEFNNNVIGIYYPQDIGSPNSFIDILGYSSTFSSSTFQSSSPMTLAYFNGQHEFPLDKKPYAGMVLNDLVPSLPGLPSIPFSINTTPCIFNNMNYGIYARNSQLDVFNCQFKNINRSPSYVAVDFTCAVYSDNACSYCQSVLPLNVGYSSTNNSNLFDMCQVGIYSVGETDVNISNNTFLNSVSTFPDRFFDINLRNSSGGRNINISTNSFTDFHLGCVMYQIANASLLMQNNIFTSLQPLNNYQSYTSTAVLITASSGTIMHAAVYNNTFNNSRIGIYLSGIRGNNANDFDINQNFIFNNIPFSDLQNLYNAGYSSYGIWSDNCRYMNIRFNHFGRQQLITGAPQKFDLMLRALNIKQGRFLEISENEVINFGTPMRFVSNCNSTNLHCNFMTSCYNGIYLDLASMTPQGAPNDPWDNKWYGFNSTLRIAGQSSSPLFVYWYHRGTTCSSACSNAYSPGPFGPFTITAVPNQTSAAECEHGNVGGGTPDMIAGIADNSISYSYFPDESKYYDEEYAYKYLKENSSLINSNPLYQSFFASEQQSNIGKFDEAEDAALNGNLSDALTKLNDIVDQNKIEYNKKYVATLELEKKINKDDTYSALEKNELESIAWQTAWEGGSAVFDARRLLMLEVDDQARNLKIRRNTSLGSDLLLNVFPNPSNGIVNFYSETSLNDDVKIIDAFGKTVLIRKLNNGKLSINNLNSGVFFAGLLQNSNVQSMIKFIVIK